MTENQEEKWDDMTLESLEAELRSLPEVDVPETLEARLLAAIPDRQPAASEDYRAERHPGLWDFGVTAAAAALILALILTVNYGLSEPSQTLSTQLTDMSLRHTGWELRPLLSDQNALVEDTNYTNSTCQTQ